MPDVHLLSIGRAVPERRYTQAELYAHRPWPESPLLSRLFLDSPIATRALFVPPEWYGEARQLTDTNEAWRRGALSLGAEALRQSLTRASRRPQEVDLLAVTTVTGYATPGLDLLLARQVGLRPDLARAHFNCIGCHAAIPLLRVAADHARCRPDSTAVALAVEICSACFQADENPENLVALALFADGAASVVLSTRGSGPRIVGFCSAYDFDHIEALGFGLTSEGFRIVLDPSIPHVIGQRIHETVDSLLREYGVDREQVSCWCFHPGGSRILDAAQRALGLDDAQLEPSRRVLRAHGNMSSPSVLFVLAEALREGRGQRGCFGVLAAFGPGLGIEVALIAF